MTLDWHFDVPLMLVILSAWMISATTYWGMEGIATELNGHVSPPLHFVWVRSASSIKLHYEICHTVPPCIDVCGARVIYVHSITFGMSHTCIHLRVHKHPISQRICHESIDMAYQFVTKEASKTPNTKINVWATSKQFFADYLLKTPLVGESIHLHEVTLEAVMYKFATLMFPNCRNFMARSKL